MNLNISSKQNSSKKIFPKRQKSVLFAIFMMHLCTEWLFSKNDCCFQENISATKYLYCC